MKANKKSYNNKKIKYFKDKSLLIHFVLGEIHNQIECAFLSEKINKELIQSLYDLRESVWTELALLRSKYPKSIDWY
jgi:hypothetical protein